MELRQDRNSELCLTLGKGYVIIGNLEKAEGYLKRALYLYPSSGYYVFEIASYYVAKNDFDAALGYIRSFDRYIDKYRGPYNPRGIFVYKIRDLEADLQYKKGHSTEAFKLAQTNLQDARNGVYVITSAKSRDFTGRDQFLEYLKRRADLYRSRITG
jgi:tetratricopeptide (TPR) repeat protein